MYLPHKSERHSTALVLDKIIKQKLIWNVSAVHIMFSKINREY